MDFNNTAPIFVQVMDYIKVQVATGHFTSGQKIPSIRDMSQNLKLNPNTVGRAYQELERAGITTTQRGLGVFVTENIGARLKEELSTSHIKLFLKEMNILGFDENQTLQALESYLANGNHQKPSELSLEGKNGIL